MRAPEIFSENSFQLYSNSICDNSDLLMLKFNLGQSLIWLCQILPLKNMICRFSSWLFSKLLKCDTMAMFHTDNSYLGMLEVSVSWPSIDQTSNGSNHSKTSTQGCVFCVWWRGNKELRNFPYQKVWTNYVMYITFLNMLKIILNSYVESVKNW